MLTMGLTHITLERKIKQCDLQVLNSQCIWVGCADRRETRETNLIRIAIFLLQISFETFVVDFFLHFTFRLLA